MQSTLDDFERIRGERRTGEYFKAKIAEAKPTVDMFQHIVATIPPRTGFTVALLDGTTYTTTSADFMFIDGMSIVVEGHRIYIPKTSIRTITIHNPGDEIGG